MVYREERDSDVSYEETDAGPRKGQLFHGKNSVFYRMKRWVFPEASRACSKEGKDGCSMIRRKEWPKWEQTVQ